MSVTEEYLIYLRSDTWQRLRSKRLAIDEYKCQRCGSPYGLQVHHLVYPAELGTEDPYKDLITLCGPCHELIEHQKKTYRKDKKDAMLEQVRFEKRAIWRAIKRQSCYDRSAIGMGTRDYCNVDVIKEDFGPLLDKDVQMIGYVERVRSYFRNRRYKIILKMLDDGFTPEDIWFKTGFSWKMVDKVTKDPEKARTIMKHLEPEIKEMEDEDDEQAE